MKNNLLLFLYFAILSTQLLSCIRKKYSIIPDQDGGYLKGVFDNKDSIKNGIWEDWITEPNYKRYEWTFKNNEKDGPYTAFRENGTVEAKGFFKHGTISDTLSFFDSKGKCYQKEVWKPSPSFSSSTLVVRMEIE